MLARGRACLFFTGATASLRGGAGYAAFAAAKFGLPAIAQRAARELGPRNIHVAHIVIDAGGDTAWVRDRIREGEASLENLAPGQLMRPVAVAEAYWQLYQQPRNAWTFEQEIRPFGEKMVSVWSRWNFISTSAAPTPI
jgi:NAD(P)-dependent dehydrogenase (short-subunit alcohol dehydrogenase family)